MAPPVSWHAKQMALDRYGVKYATADWRRLVMDIVSRRATLVSKRPTDNCEVWMVEIGSTPAKVIFDPSQLKIITVLPPGDSRFNVP